MENRMKKIGWYIGVTLVVGVILSIISARINITYPQKNEFFDYQMFLLIVVGMVIAIIVPLLFRKFKRGDEL